MKQYDLENDTLKQKFGFRAVIVLAGGFLMHIALGQGYSVGNFAPYFISYIRNRTDDTDIENVDVLWITAIVGSTDWIGLTAGGLMERCLGLRATSLIGSVLFSGSVAVTYFSVHVSYVTFLLTFSAINGMAGLMVYGISVQTAIKWLPHRTSLAAGIVLSGYGGGAFVFNQVITQFINPDNLSPALETEDGERYFTDPGLLDRVPYCFLLIGGVSMCLTFIGSMSMSSPPNTTITENVVDVKTCDSTITMTDEAISTVSQDVHFPSLTGREETHSNEKETPTKTAVLDSTAESTDKYDIHSPKPSLRQIIKQVLRTRSFYVLWFQMLFTVWAFSFVAILYKAYGQTFIEDDHFLALIGTLSSVFNSIGRPIWGMVMDRFGYKVTVRCISIGLTVLFATLFLTENLHKIFLLIWICLMYFCYCGTWAVFPATLSKLFGASSVALTFGLSVPAASISGIAVLVTGTTLKGVIGWHGMFFLSAGVAFMPFLLTFAFNGVDVRGKRI